jgi:purine-binding chemotaxis protein CheW
MRDQQYISFTLDGHLFGVDILLVREIIRNFEYTPVEHAPEGVQGLLNLRGQIITVLDLAEELGLPECGEGGRRHCIILKAADEMARFLDGEEIIDQAGSETVGILVDEITDVIPVSTEQIESPPANANGVNGDKLTGVAKLPSKLLLILSMRKVMDRWQDRSRRTFAGMNR